MKLYTEEQLMKAIQMADKTHYLVERERNEIVNSITPIELPSDEEIKHYWSKTNITPLDIAAINGALVIVEQIKQGRFLKKPKGGNK